MTPRPTLSIHVVRAIFFEAVTRGAHPLELASQFGVTPVQIADVDARVPVEAVRRMWEELSASLAPDDFGIAVARRTDGAGALHVVGYLVQAASTVGEALSLALRYQRLVGDAIHTRWIASESRILFEARDPALSIPRHALEFAIATALLLVRRATGTSLSPRRVTLAHPRPASDAAACALFGCEIDWDAAEHAVTMASADLDAPIRTADPQLVAILDQHARGLEARLPAADSFALVVRRELAKTLAKGETDLDAIARRLRTSRRTLQRRLGAEGTSLQQVLDGLRRDLALEHLARSDTAIRDVVFLLGFSDQSAFHHAFVRWTGVTPAAYRRGERATG